MIDEFAGQFKQKGGWALLWLVLVLVACAPPSVASPEMPSEMLLEMSSMPTRTPAPPVVVATFTPLPEAAPPDGAVEVEALSAPEAAPDFVAPVGVTEHVVQSGETLLGLALHYGVPMAAIQLQNDFGIATGLRAGQILDIPPRVGWEGASPFWVVYEVTAGETLSAIGARYGFDVATLQGVNGLGDADRLSIGQPLILPLTAPAEVVARAPAPTPTPVPPAPPTPTAAPGADAPPPPPAPTATPVPAPAPARPPADVAALPGEIFRLVNAQRAQYGLSPLAWNATLAHAAQAHADDCYARGWCSHTGSDGATVRERMIRAGYTPTRWSECWAWFRTPEQAVAFWMDEVPPNDPHRRTILSTWLTEVGVGVVPGSTHGYYFIAKFGAPR